MKKLLSTVWSEGLKVRRSKVFGLSFLFFSFVPIMLGFLYFISKNPEFANNVGLVGSSSKLDGSADWASFMGRIGQAVTASGLLGFAFTASWIFGREYSDRTIKDLLALPISRAHIVLSKFIIMFIWCILLTLYILLTSFVIGTAINLDGWSTQILFHSFSRMFITSILITFISTPVAFIANFSRGYLAPIGFAIVTLILGNFIGVLGPIKYYPWAIPEIYRNAGLLGVNSWIIFYLTGVLGLLGTFAWWRYADQS